MTNAAPSLNWLSGELEQLKAGNLYREFRVLEHIKGIKAIYKGRPIQLFSGNDYLGLSQHPEVIKAAEAALESHGVGAGSARLISGTSDQHACLEEKIARFEGKQRALVFPTGYQTNVGVISGLVGREDCVVIDKLSHASIVDAVKLSQATVRVYPHGNLAYLEKLLETSRGRRTWVITDSVFSMDGDLAPLPELVALKNRYGASLIIDEAHGTGVFGSNGRGVAEHFGLADEIDVHIGTLSKAVGVLGGFVAGSNDVIEYVTNHARSFLFTTAQPALLCAACIRAIELIESKPEIRQQLWENVHRMKALLKDIGAPVSESSASPILPVILGDEKRTLAVAGKLLESGFLVPAVRYPTVAKGRARLRITVSSLHTGSAMTALAAALRTILSGLPYP